ncbi:hypothetical protein EDC65_4278 [Stella humosa]|uniref:Uncharacterized protein n=1 Tax=Stella humosa TaxID=94 RepID=A0A3N1KXW6_9PROT|nr:hypothetical protein [Stella humosa]ROP83629.1 hypothetical protein EDC65_4278 [Stella humosa]BBK33098.1 hypothetical protein STHU_37320 [Stella humosa]
MSDAKRRIVPEWLLERFRANPVPRLTPEQLAAGSAQRFVYMVSKHLQLPTRQMDDRKRLA